MGPRPSLRVELGRAGRALAQRSGEQVVHEDAVVGDQPAAERAEVGIGVDRDHAVAAQWASRAPRMAVISVLPTPPLGETTATVTQRPRRGLAMHSSS